MSTKKIICTAVALASYFLFTAFTIGCWAQLTLSVNAALSEYGRDQAWCESNTSITYDMCITEASASFNYNIDKSILAWENCL